MEPGSISAPGDEPGGGEIYVADRRWHAHVRNLRLVVTRAMRAASCNASVVLTDDRTVQKLNARDRGQNKPTNVLTYEHPAEILLALGVVLREAKAAHRTVAAHLSHLLVHGALHLEGYDHHHAGDAKRMEGEEAWLLARIGIANPWKNQ